MDTPLFRNGQQLILPELQCLDYENLVPIVVEQFCEDETTIPKIQQFLLSLPSLHRPLSFEVMGWGPQPKWDHEKSKEIMQAQCRGEKRSIREAICGWEEPYTVVQFVADKTDAAQVQNQLISHYPNSAIVIGENVYNATPGSNLQDANTHAATLLLDHVYCQPLRIFGKLDPDPLGVAIAAMEQLDKDDWALLQILFEPARNPWAETMTAALTNPYKPNEYLFNNVSEKMLREKFSSPLFAVSIRILASKMSVYRQLEGWAQQFAAPPQGMSPNKSSWEGNSMPEFERNYMSWSVDARCTHLPGMILNLNELSSLVHLPSESVVTERLRRVKSRTRPAPKIKKSDESVILGDNMHRGKKQLAVIPLKQRLRHCYVAGATGTGKSTLLLNMIIQDIQAGRGVGVLDPHGDLINAVLERIPQERVDDVILFDPADDEFPFALNILEAKDESEQERIVNETISAMQKQFAASWGQRLQRILTYTIQTVLQVIPGATLGEVERMLVDHEFREKTVEKITDPRLAVFWREQFKFLTSAIDPVLNKLSVFLASRVVRNIICQPRSAVDFDVLINQRKILLANLSTGLLRSCFKTTL